jgi:cell division protein FtsB
MYNHQHDTDLMEAQISLVEHEAILAAVKEKHAAEVAELERQIKNLEEQMI